MIKRILSLFGNGDTLPFNFKSKPKQVDMSGGIEPLFNAAGEFVVKLILIFAAIAFVIGGAIMYLFTH